MAAEAASFNTEILSMSLGNTSAILIDIPSTNTRGPAFFHVPTPRTVIVGLLDPGCPDDFTTVKPGAKPAKASFMVTIG